MTDSRKKWKPDHLTNQNITVDVNNTEEINQMREYLGLPALKIKELNCVGGCGRKVESVNASNQMCVECSRLSPGMGI